MKKRKCTTQIKINPKVKKVLYSAKQAEKVEFAKEVKYPKEKKPLKAIRNKCLWCSGDSKHETKLCPNEQCPLWPFRLGKNPFIIRELTEEQRAAAGERLKKAREARETQVAEEKKVRKSLKRKG